jgi:BolA protein
MSMREQIEASLQASLSPMHVTLVDETSQHSVPAGSESHWNLVVVSEAFTGQRLVKRQRAVYAALRQQLDGGIHALTMKTLTPEEWVAQGGQVDNASPPCLGGSKSE